MKIAVCVKHVPISENVEVDENNRLVRDNAESDTNPCDLNAMETALRLKQEAGGTIDVYSMGPENAMASLKKCLAMGADQAYLISGRKFAGGDTLGTARVLAEAIQKQGEYDVVFTGSESSDGGTGQVGPMLAELLHMPDVSETVEVKAGNGLLNVKKRVDGGNLLLSVKMPVLLTVPFGCNEPTLPTLRTQRKANRAEIPVVGEDDLDLSAETIGENGALSIVTGLEAASGGNSAEKISGSDDEIAAKLYELLEEGRNR